ncbi:MAG: FAD-binding oxidoreductase [Myxococcales bacterium]|nr:FAD-binding oxidoreductase [Myxococcales bacterium]
MDDRSPGVLPFEEISPWVRAPEDPTGPLTGDLRADVVVIGAGYTGLSTALSLRAQGADVVVLEQGFAGSGASGRNAGHVAPTIGKDIPSLLRFFGSERAAKLVRFADAAVAYAEEVIRKHEIDCEYEPNGTVFAGVHPKHEARLRSAAESAAGLGAHVRFLSEGEMRERTLPAAFRCGVLEERGGILHPGRYVLGLRRAALAAGARLYEGSALSELTAGPRVTARTDGGTVTADFAVLATNAYTPASGWKPRLVAPLRVSLFETEPLYESQRDELGWSGREGIYTAHEILESYRLTVRHTLVGGSKVVRYAWGSGLAAGYDPAAFRAIEAAFRERFPFLRGLRVARFWGGWIGLTPDFLPALGVGGSHRNVLFGVGYAGHGVPQATLMGAMLAERIQGREHEAEAALQRRLFSWPPEPLRWAAAKLVEGALTALDRRTDRQIGAM